MLNTYVAIMFFKKHLISVYLKAIEHITIAHKHLIIYDTITLYIDENIKRAKSEPVTEANTILYSLVCICRNFCVKDRIK